MQSDPMPLPPPGYPISEEAVTNWFRERHQREPDDREVGVIMDAMALRNATPPIEGPVPDPEGWTNTPSAPPATRR